MDSESKHDDANEPEISRFALDGIVAEMVIEVDKEEAISPTKALKLNGLEKYDALKASALRQSSVMLGSKMDISEKDVIEKEKEIESKKSSNAIKDLQENDTSEKSGVLEHDNSKLDTDAVKDDTETVSDVECIKDKPKDLEDQEPDSLKNRPEVSEMVLEQEKCESFVENTFIAPVENNSNETNDQNLIVSEKETSETSDRKQIELSETKQSRNLSKRKSKASEVKESLVFEEQLEEEKVVEKENSKRSSGRVKSKEVLDEKETRSSSNQSRKSGRVSQTENKRNSSKLNTNAAKSVLTKAKLAAQNKKPGKVVTTQPAVRRGRKRKLQDPGPQKEMVSVKRQKQMVVTSKTKLRQKSGKSTPALSETAVSRRQSSRKTHSTAAPVVKPKAYNLYPKSISRLDTFVEVKEQLNLADLKYLRALYRLMYDRWPPKDLAELKKEILQFQGFTFNRKSDELEKRQQVLKRLPDASVIQICKILDLKEGTKDNMISDVIKFLLKPIKVIYSAVDPFQPSMQPVVKLEKISLDEKYARSVRYWEIQSDRVKMSKRKRFPSSRLSEYVSGETKTSDLGKASSSTKTEAAPIEKRRPGRPKRKANISEDADEVPTKIKAEEALGKESAKLEVDNSVVTRRRGRKRKSENRTEILKLGAKTKNLRSILKTSQKDQSVASNATSVDIKEEITDEPPVNREKETSQSSEPRLELSKRQNNLFIEREDCSSEITLSSDESKEQQAKQDAARKKKVIHKRCGLPLRCFDYIKENIMSANFSALQRLHILFFGASDKVENLKTNILSFGGFPFLEGSEEWKQKEFLLSLLAQNTLREYMNLLCIEHGDDDNRTLINKLMKFLAAPKGKQVSDYTTTQVVSSEPVSHAPGLAFTKKKALPKKAVTTPAVAKKVPPEGTSRGRTRKVLMDEEQVRRLENDFAREQRIIERANRQVEKQKLMNELDAERSGSKSATKYCQAAGCKNNSKDNKDLTFFTFPTEPIRLEKWLANIEIKQNSRKYNAFLCSQHFDVRAFTNTCKNARLLRCAVPTIPPPGCTWTVKYPCLDGYSSPGTSRVKHGSSPTKKEESDNTSLTMSIDVDSIPDYEPGKSKLPFKTPGSKKAPLQKLIGDMTKKRASMMAQQTDSELLDALLQTVYKRRALKSAGAVISVPNKGVHTRLGELDNVKFLVVTANYNDLDVLHHLIYMTEASKTRVRKNILDFAGFNFAEDSTPYKDRMEFLKSLGYDISKRIGFLLGLCPYKMDIPQQDLNELIMYFLMSPCKSKQVPIRHLPQNFFTKDMPKELCLLLQKHGENVSPDSSNSTSPPKPNPPEKQIPTYTVTSEDDSPPKIVYHQKAKKSFKSSNPPIIKRNPSSPSVPPVNPKALVNTPREQPVLKRPFQLPNILTKPSPPSTPSLTSTAIVQPSPLQKSILKSPVILNQFPQKAPDQFTISQQTPDGQQKTYKLIKLPASHPLNSAIKTPALQSQLLPQLQSNAPMAGPPLPPGIIVFKNNPPAGNVQTVVNPVPQIQLGAGLPSAPFRNPELTITPVLVDTSTNKGPTSINKGLAAPEKKVQSTSLKLDFNEKVEELHPLEDSDPTDEELYSSIQEIIHNSNFEDITLRNVIERVSAQYATFDLTKRHAFMKECVKKIIIGT